jgi:LacI family transcriptional regulator
MAEAELGPIPVSRLKIEAVSIFAALANGRRVLISRRGRVVAAIDPVGSLALETLAQFATPGKTDMGELSASDINRRSPSAAIELSLKGVDHYVTRENRLYGVLRAIGTEELSQDHLPEEQVIERQRRIDRFLVETPDAEPEQLIRFTEQVERELRLGQAAGAESASPHGIAVAISDMAGSLAKLAQDCAIKVRHWARLTARSDPGPAAERVARARMIDFLVRLVEDSIAFANNDPQYSWRLASMEGRRADEALAQLEAFGSEELAPARHRRKAVDEAQRDMVLGDIVRTLRLGKGLTQSQLAGQTGTTQSAIARLEAGERMPSLDTLQSLTETLISNERLLGLVIPDVENPFYYKVANGVERAARLEGYLLIVANSDSKSKIEQNILRSLCKRRVGGLLVIAAPGADHEFLGSEFDMGGRVVFIDRPPQNLIADFVSSDNRGGAREAVVHLIKQGHRRIAMLVGNTRVWTDGERLQGYKDALAAYEIPYVDALVREDCRDIPTAQKATEELFALSPDAIFAYNNRSAIGALQAIKKLRPTTALVGFDDFELAEMLSLTVVSQDAYELGKFATETLLRRLSGEKFDIQDARQSGSPARIPTSLIQYGGYDQAAPL